ncbi:MAG: ribosomal-processing cysteine protease Prp [Clostridia bacterium]|nr:ribosomal-processing cysteine protease Prp [Clostridia bacterium]
MIQIELFRNKNQNIVRFTVSGHAGFAESGADIVCASVTTAAFTAVNGLTDIIKIEAIPQVSDGFLSCRLPEDLSPEQRLLSDVLLESMVLSFLNIEEQYGDYVKIKEFFI